MLIPDHLRCQDCEGVFRLTSLLSNTVEQRKTNVSRLLLFQFFFPNSKKKKFASSQFLILCFFVSFFVQFCVVFIYFICRSFEETEREKEVFYSFMCTVICLQNYNLFVIVCDSRASLRSTVTFTVPYSLSVHSSLSYKFFFFILLHIALVILYTV